MIPRVAWSLAALVTTYVVLGAAWACVVGIDVLRAAARASQSGGQAKGRAAGRRR